MVAAQALGLTIAQSLLLRMDKVIQQALHRVSASGEQVVGDNTARPHDFRAEFAPNQALANPSLRIGAIIRTGGKS
jgi:hypothetical protein